MQPGDLICARYRLLRLIDVGGMGEVWAARNELTQKQFAIKFLLPALAERPDALERFVREAETAGSLDHVGIVNVFDVAQAEDGRPFIVMELLAGESLETRLENEGALSPMEAAALMSQVAAGLEVAHRAGIVHRDLSLANIFLARNPEGGRAIPKILDFGVSKTMDPEPGRGLRTGEGTILGCPDFMSPEQAMGAEAVDARTDVWSLGVVLYSALAGTSPFVARNYNALMAQILTRPHRPILEVVPSLDFELAGLVEACLVKDREGRIQTAQIVADRLSAIAHRLAGASAKDLSPKRRATDRLTGRTPVVSRASLRLATDDDEPIPAFRPSRIKVAAVSGLLGAAFGVAMTLWLGPELVKRQGSEAAAVATNAAALPPVVAKVPASPPRTLADDEPNLALAVARGAFASDKTHRR